MSRLPHTYIKQSKNPTQFNIHLYQTMQEPRAIQHTEVNPDLEWIKLKLSIVLKSLMILDLILYQKVLQPERNVFYLGFLIFLTFLTVVQCSQRQIPSTSPRISQLHENCFTCTLSWCFKVSSLALHLLICNDPEIHIWVLDLLWMYSKRMYSSRHFLNRASRWRLAHLIE